MLVAINATNAKKKLTEPQVLYRKMIPESNYHNINLLL